MVLKKLVEINLPHISRGQRRSGCAGWEPGKRIPLAGQPYRAGQEHGARLGRSQSLLHGRGPAPPPACGRNPNGRLNRPILPARPGQAPGGGLPPSPSLPAPPVPPHLTCNVPASPQETPEGACPEGLVACSPLSFRGFGHLRVPFISDFSHLRRPFPSVGPFT